MLIQTISSLDKLLSFFMQFVILTDLSLYFLLQSHKLIHISNLFKYFIKRIIYKNIIFIFFHGIKDAGTLIILNCFYFWCLSSFRVIRSHYFLLNFCTVGYCCWILISILAPPIQLPPINLTFIKLFDNNMPKGFCYHHRGY